MISEEKKPKLCFVATIKDNHTRKWMRYFIDKGYEIHWISLPSKYIIETEGVNVNHYLMRNFNSKFLNILLNIIFVRRMVKKINPDFLHVHYVGVNGVLGALSGFHPFIATVYGSDVLIAPKSKLKRIAVKYILKKADLITCDGENSISVMADMGINVEKIKLIYFGVNTELFCPGPKDKVLEEKLGLNNSITVISLRSLKPVYNVETLIKAIPSVIKAIPEIKFIIVGKGPEEKKLKDMAESLGISKRIIFTGWIPNKELPRYLRTSDIYVSTSLSDGGIAMSTSEAMACGLPAIISDFGDNKKWVIGGENGFIFKMEDYKSLAGKIIYLAKNENLRKEFGKVGRRIIEEKNNYYKEMEKMENIYKNYKNSQL